MTAGEHLFNNGKAARNDDVLDDGREAPQRVFPHASTLRFYLQVGSVLTGVQALDARSWNAPNHSSVLLHPGLHSPPSTASAAEHG